jgi:type I restriction enzyme, S subunit
MNKIKIKDIADVKNGSTPSTSNPEFYDGEIIWITPKDLSDQNTRYIYKGERSISEKGLESCSSVIVPKGTILLSSRAPIGLLSIAAQELCTNQGFKNIVPKPKKANSEFLYYHLKTKNKELQYLGSGTTFKEISKNSLENYEITIPEDVKDQQKIASVLSALDSKIELNNRINAELEAMAKTLYDYWFVQFDFPDENGKPYKSSGGKMIWNEELKREIPDGWEVSKINKILPVKDGTHDSPKYQDFGFPLITSKHLLESGIDFQSANLISEQDYISINKRSLVETGDILFSMIGTIGNIYKVEETNINFAVKNVALYKTSQKIDYKNYVYMFLKSWDMQRYMANVMSGSIQKFIGLGDLRNMPLMVSDKHIKRYEEKTRNIFQQIHNLRIQNQQLANLRDWLLPMLMNGQVRVNSEEYGNN